MTKQTICKFLKIEEMDILNKFTMLGEETSTNNGQDIFKTKLDVAENILSPSELIYLRMMEPLDLSCGEVLQTILQYRNQSYLHVWHLFV